MKRNSTLVLVAIFVAMFGVVSVLSQTAVAPVVPMEVFGKGRAEVTRHLLLRVDTAKMEIEGQSVATTSDRNTAWISRQDLKEMGYRNGSFQDISRILATRRLKTRIIQLKDGSYDVRVKVELFDNTGSVLFTGSGYTPVYVGPNGPVVSECQLYVSIPEYISVSVPGEVGSGKWLSGSWGEQSLDFWAYVNQGEGLSVFQNVPMSIIGKGYFAIQPWNGSLWLVNLVTGGYSSSDQILILFGKSQSSDIVVVDNGLPTIQFTKFGDKIYGRYPLLEIPAMSFNGMIDFGVPVWGTDLVISPIRAKVIGLNDRTEIVIAPDEATGFFPVRLDPGQAHHIILDFGGQIEDYPPGKG